MGHILILKLKIFEFECLHFFGVVKWNPYRTPVMVCTPEGSTCVDTHEEIFTCGQMCGHTCVSTPTGVSSCVNRSSGVGTYVGKYPQMWPHL